MGHWVDRGFVEQPPAGVDGAVVRSMLPAEAPDELVAFYSALLSDPAELVRLHPAVPCAQSIPSAHEEFRSRRAWFAEHDDAQALWRQGPAAFREYFGDTPIGPNHWELHSWPEWYAVLPEDPASPCRVECFPEGEDTFDAFASLAEMLDLCSRVFEDDTERRLIPDLALNGIVTVTGGERSRFAHLGAPPDFFPW